MKGTELSDKQLKAAERFILLMRADGNTLEPEASQVVAQTWDSLVRLVALYGALRAASVSRGGSMEEPGEIFKPAQPERQIVSVSDLSDNELAQIER